MHQDIFIQNLELNITVDNKSEQLQLNSGIFEFKEEIREKLEHVRTDDKLGFYLDILNHLEEEPDKNSSRLRQLEIILMDKETIDNLVNNSYITLVFVTKQEQTNEIVNISESSIISLRDFIVMSELKGDVIKLIYFSGDADRIYFRGNFCKLDNNIESIGDIEIKLVIDRLIIEIQNFVVED